MHKSRLYYFIALVLALIFHGTLLAYTMGDTYDAYVHIFFADHYSDNWFDPWNYKWYTGFTMTSYPPLVHQIIALLSKIVGLKLGFIIWCLIAILLFVRGVFHFSKIWVSDTVAGYAAVLSVFSSSYIEAVHLFGQLPSITGIALLLNACPLLYKWIRYNQTKYLLAGLSLIACLTCAHHVTTIFGMVFFVAPVLGVAVIDIISEERGGIENVRIMHFVNKVWQLKWKAIFIGVAIILITICMIFPYWYWSKTDPITQVSIPHGSRADFIADLNLGLVFFLIPWGIMLFFLPAIFHRVFHKRNLFLGLSFLLLFILGTGGTTPIPKMILGENAFNILTLDRFTFWASIIALPFFASVMHSLFEGNLATFIRDKFSVFVHKASIVTIIIMMILIDALTVNMTNMKPMQPDAIKVKPIAQFMERDGHDRWRFLTLGFGDQMAWLSANTDAYSVDGNYHSARRLPEMTTRAVERIENSKYLGEEGLGALRDFLTVPEKYNLKYIFNNDKYYESVLFFYGWTKLKPLENNIDVWERKDVPVLPSILPRNNIPEYQKILWGILPLSSLLLSFLINLIWRDNRPIDEKLTLRSNRLGYIIYIIWFLVVFVFTITKLLGYINSTNHQTDPKELLEAYFHYIDFKKYDQAHQLLDPKDEVSMEQFMLELSLEDGLLASYAKLDTIYIDSLVEINSEKIFALVTAQWITAVQSYDTKHNIELNRSDQKWYIKKSSFEMDIPEDQLIRLPDINFMNQGRRQAISGSTASEDILDRPEIYINQANLVMHSDTPYVVGKVTNTDNDPAYINIKTIIYDKRGQEITSNNTNEIIVHNLLPKEGSFFKIELDSISQDSIAEFAVFVNSVVTDEKLYKFYGLKDLGVEEGSLNGQIINYGSKEMTIPQVLISYQKKEKIHWVEHMYLDTGVRPQREKEFESKLEIKVPEILLTGTDDNLIINGVSRKEYAYSTKSNSNTSLNYKDYSLQLKLNSFISNLE